MIISAWPRCCGRAFLFRTPVAGPARFRRGLRGHAGRVIGMDRDAGMVEQTREAHAEANLTFIVGDVLTMGEREAFDIVNAARLLQWVATPGEAVKRMAAAARVGGSVVALDYNHAENRLFRKAAVRDVYVTEADEVSGESIGAHVMEALRPQMVAEGAVSGVRGE